MFGLGVWELALILVLLIFFYGAKRLPEIGEGLGKSIREFKQGYHKYDEPKEGDSTGDQAIDVEAATVDGPASLPPSTDASREERPQGAGPREEGKAEEKRA